MKKFGKSTYAPKRVRRNQPSGIPSHIKAKSIIMSCKNHDYLYVREAWTNKKTGVKYRKGYYDEDGKYYDTGSIAFKKSDGSYKAHYKCEYCGTELENNWKEGGYPRCKSCDAEIIKTPVHIDEIININKVNTSNGQSGSWNKILDIIIFTIAVPIIMQICKSNVTTYYLNQDNYTDSSTVKEIESNLEIYGSDIYLDEVSPNVYRICESEDEYEKHVTWDDELHSYYDADSNCYLWYNNYVSPNLWRYWYDDIAGDSCYGWMQCEGGSWYIEVSDTEWGEYEGDATQLWYIEDAFD